MKQLGDIIKKIIKSIGTIGFVIAVAIVIGVCFAIEANDYTPLIITLYGIINTMAIVII